MSVISNPAKKVLRDKMKTILATMTIEDRFKQSASILSMDVFKQSSRISIYLSMDIEVSTKEIVNAMFKLRIEVLVPCYSCNTMKMVKINDIEDYESLPLTKWNIKQPRGSHLRENANLTGGLDLVLLPGVAFTKNGGRMGHGMGHGMGFYDKYLIGLFDANLNRAAPPEWRGDLDRKIKERKTSLIAFAFNEQIVEEIPIESTDVLLDKIVTSE